MSDFMSFLYDHYIKAFIDSQPKDDGDLFRHDVLSNELTHTQQQEDLEPVLRFTAVHAFLLGMQAGRELR